MISSSSGELFSGGAFGLAVAVAGNNSHGEMNPRILRDYPRVCGEQQNLDYSVSVEVGLPPRMRGTGLYGFHFSFREEDYPRVCGE